MIVEVDGVWRDFGRGEHVVHAGRDVSFTAGSGELVAVRGRSGAGRTTLLNLIGGLDRPTAGRVSVVVAVARALANDLQLLIADEPTGQLDSETGRSIMELIAAVVRAHGTTTLVATHDTGLMEIAPDRVLSLRDGELC